MKMFFLIKQHLNNFAGFQREFRVGNTKPICTFCRSKFYRSDYLALGVSVTQSGGPVTRTITDSNITRVLVTVQIPTLQIIEGDGDIIGHSVSFSISLQFNGGGFACCFSKHNKRKDK